MDQSLLDRALAVGGEKTKKATVDLAPREFVARREQKRLLDLFGKIEWDDNCDYKRERNRPSRNVAAGEASRSDGSY